MEHMRTCNMLEGCREIDKYAKMIKGGGNIRAWDQEVLVYLRGDLKRSFVEALLDDLSDGRLWKSAGVDLLHHGLSSWSPLYECRLQSDLDEAVV